MLWLWLVVGALAIIALLALGWRPLRRLGGEIQVERARELFFLERERIQSQFLGAASATGKPRGLRWKSCAFDEDIEFARDRQSRQLLALVGVTIQFDAVEGSDMEGLPAVGNLRSASAVFFFDGGRWLTAGKAVFNLNPSEAIEHFQAQYEALAAHHP